MQLKDSALFRQQAYINGEWVDAENGETFDVINPATGAVLGKVPSLGEIETRRAIAAAEKAWSGWRSKTAKERAVILRRWYELMLENSDDLATIMTLEMGKSLTEAKGEVGYAASFIDWFAEEGRRVYGETIPANNADQRIVVTHMPIGVAAAITPWNFPSAMITRKAAPALAAGCPMVVKPAESTPFSALALAELATRAGVPAGYFQCCHRRPGSNRCRNDIQPNSSQTVLHRLYSGWQTAYGAKCREREKTVAGTWWQCAVYRV